MRSNHLSYKPVEVLLLVFHQTICVSTSKYFFKVREVIQPQVPLRLPCYDFTPVMNHKVVSALPEEVHFFFCNPPHGVTGGVYRPGNVFTVAF